MSTHALALGISLIAMRSYMPRTLHIHLASAKFTPWLLFQPPCICLCVNLLSIRLLHVGSGHSDGAVIIAQWSVSLLKNAA